MSFDVGAQKIDDTTLYTYGIVVADFLMTDKANQSLECLTLPLPVQTSIATCLTEFISKKRGNARDLQISSLDIRSLRHIRIITTSTS